MHLLHLTIKGINEIDERFSNLGCIQDQTGMNGASLI